MTDEKAPGITSAELQAVVKAFAESDLRELSVTAADVELYITRDVGSEADWRRARPPVSTREAQPAPAAPTVADQTPAQVPVAEHAPDEIPTAHHGAHEVRSPAVGIFYRRPAPDKDPFVDAGDHVAVGDPVGSIEVMKMYTSVASTISGTVIEICVEDGAFVEHGQVLMYIDPTAN